MRISDEVLTSRKNPKIQLFSSLHDKKARDEHRLFMAEGEKLLLEAISVALPIAYIVISEENQGRIFSLLSGKEEEKALRDAEVIVVSTGCFEKISTEKAPQGVITIVKHLDFFKKCTIINKETLDFWEGKRLVILSSMQDPGNLGAVIRSALAFGADCVLLGPDSCDPYHPRALRAAMGSLFRVGLYMLSDLFAAVTALQKSGRRVYAAELTEAAVSLPSVDLRKSDVFMIGNEGHGIPRELSVSCDGSVYIPISHATESLNAAVAAAIFMWEQEKASIRE